MPNNGAAALHLTLQPAPESKDEPPAAPASGKADEGIKLTLGQAMADATEALGAGLADYDAGGRLTDANRARGGETIAKVVEIQLATLGEMPDFGVIALAEGRRTLLARHGVALRQQLGTDAGLDYVLDELLTHVLAVATKVTAIEMAFRAH
jgi:hypothetical protein